MAWQNQLHGTRQRHILSWNQLVIKYVSPTFITTIQKLPAKNRYVTPNGNILSLVPPSLQPNLICSQPLKRGVSINNQYNHFIIFVISIVSYCEFYILVESACRRNIYLHFTVIFVTIYSITCCPIGSIHDIITCVCMISLNRLLDKNI